MTFTDYLNKPASKKITLVEIDTPIYLTWNNYAPGIWFAFVPAAKITDTDDYGNVAYIGSDDSSKYNFQSLSVNGELYTEVNNLTDLISSNKSWYYDNTTDLKIYVHLDLFNPPCVYAIIAAGAAIGFTNQIDTTVNNYFEDIYYKPLIKSIPNIAKSKDALHFGLSQYKGGTITFENTGGDFDNFATSDLYGQPVRIKLSFEGLPFDEAKLVYSGKVGKFSHDMQSFKLSIEDPRKLLGLKMPVNVFSSAVYPSLDDSLEGTPIPIIYGSVIKVPAYKTSAGNWKFADTTFNAIDSGITVTKEDGSTFTHAGTETDGTFTGTDTDDKLFVTCEQSTVSNGLDVIADIIANYEGITYNATHYDVTEWVSERAGVKDAGVWIGKGNLKTTKDVIERICTDNQGIFDVLVDGRFTFRSYDPDRVPISEIFEDELLDDPAINYDTTEYLSSAIILYSKNYKEKEYQSYTNKTYQDEVYARYRNYRSTESDGLETLLTSEVDAMALSEKIMDGAKFIKPKINLVTKTQNIELRLLDNILYTFKRQSGKEIVARSRYQVLGVVMDLVNYEVSINIKQIETDDNIYVTNSGVPDLLSSGILSYSVLGGA